MPQGLPAIEVVYIVLGVLGIAGTVMWRAWATASKLRDDLNAALASVRKRIETVDDKIDSAKLEVAREYMSKAEGERMLARFERSLDAMKQDLFRHMDTVWGRAGKADP